MYTEMPGILLRLFSARRSSKIAHDNQGRTAYVFEGHRRALCPLKWCLKAARAKTYGQKKPTSSASIPGKFRLAEEVTAGGVCAVTGLTHTYPGRDSVRKKIPRACA